MGSLYPLARQPLWPDPRARDRPFMHLFVYGTLRSSTAHPMHATMRGFASLVGDARIRGRLYLVADYPGLVLDDSAGWVVGELYRLRDLEGLALLDAYESAEYQRIRRRVCSADGGDPTAWLYEYRGPTDNRPVILSGDFLQRGG